MRKMMLIMLAAVLLTACAAKPELETETKIMVEEINDTEPCTDAIPGIDETETLFYEEEVYEEEVYEEEIYTDTYEEEWNYFDCSPQWNSTYMGVHCITATGSEQYHWLQSHDWGYDDNGICSYDGRILVALTPTFGGIGDYVDLLFEDGSVLYCIIGDHKANSDVYGHWSDGFCNVLELIVSPDWYDGHENMRFPEVIAWR